MIDPKNNPTLRDDKRCSKAPREAGASNRKPAAKVGPTAPESTPVDGPIAGQSRGAPWLRYFEERERSQRATSPSWIQLLRKAGIAHFAKLGFPTTAEEDWRFTDVTPLSLHPWQPASDLCSVLGGVDPEVAARVPRFRDCCELVFIDGRFVSALSSNHESPLALSVCNLTRGLASLPGAQFSHFGRVARYGVNGLAALNTAMFEDGAFIVVPAHCVVKQPIHVIFLTTAEADQSAFHPRNFIWVKAGGEVKVIEHYVSVGQTLHFTNAVTEMTIEEGARLEYCKIQDESPLAYHVALTECHQARGSRFVSHSVSRGAKLGRHELIASLNGENAECTFNGLFLGGNRQLVDHHTLIEHHSPRCASHEDYHGILDGQAQGVFNGKILVRKEAQKTDAKQSNRNLLLSENATIHSKPQLEIFADDVRCTHGATVGSLDKEALFYLRSRGLDLEAARRLLIRAFASQILNRISLAPVREALDGFV